MLGFRGRLNYNFEFNFPAYFFAQRTSVPFERKLESYYWRDPSSR